VSAAESFSNGKGKARLLCDGAVNEKPGNMTPKNLSPPPGLTRPE